MELLKLLSANEIVAQVINFLLLLIILRIFFWKRILKVLDGRKEKIISDFERIEQAKKDVEKLKSDYLTKIAAIEETSKEKLEEALEEGQKLVEETRKEASIQAQKVIDAAEEDVKYEVAKAKDELKKEIIELTIRATENVIGEKLTEENDKKLIEEFIKEIDKK